MMLCELKVKKADGFCVVQYLCLSITRLFFIIMLDIQNSCAHTIRTYTGIIPLALVHACAILGGFRLEAATIHLKTKHVFFYLFTMHHLTLVTLVMIVFKISIIS